MLHAMSALRPSAARANGRIGSIPPLYATQRSERGWPKPDVALLQLNTAQSELAPTVNRQSKKYCAAPP